MLKREEVSILNIIFVRVHDNHKRVSIQTISTETLEFVFSLYRIKTGEYFLKFSFKGKQLDAKLSLVDAGFSDNSIIITDLGKFPVKEFEPNIIIFIELHRPRGFSTDVNTLSFQVKPNMLVKELISLYSLKMVWSPKCKFIFKSRELFPEMTLAHSGLVNESKIIALSIQHVVGAGSSWRYKLINIKFIKISKSIDTNTNILNSELTSLLKLCLLKEISSIFNFLYFDFDNKCQELKKNIPELTCYILHILSNGFVVSKDIKKTIT